MYRMTRWYLETSTFAPSQLTSYGINSLERHVPSPLWVMNAGPNCPKSAIFYCQSKICCLSRTLNLKRSTNNFIVAILVFFAIYSSRKCNISAFSEQTFCMIYLHTDASIIIILSGSHNIKYNWNKTEIK